MPFPALVFSRALWMCSFTLDLGKPQRMVQIWKGWVCNPNKKIHSQTKRRGCMWKQHQGRAWGPVLCCLHPLPAEGSPGPAVCSPPSRQDEPEDAACSRKSWAVLAAWALPVDYRMSDPKSPWASGHDHQESAWVGAASLEGLIIWVHLFTLTRKTLQQIQGPAAFAV